MRTKRARDTKISKCFKKRSSHFEVAFLVSCFYNIIRYVDNFKTTKKNSLFKPEFFPWFETKRKLENWIPGLLIYCALKFRFFKKATKFETISHMIWRLFKLWSETNRTMLGLWHFVTVSGHFFAHYINSLNKTGNLIVILRSPTHLNLNYIKNYDIKDILFCLQFFSIL